MGDGKSRMHLGKTRCFVDIDGQGLGCFIITTFPEADQKLIVPGAKPPEPQAIAMVWDPETAAWVCNLGTIKTRMIAVKDKLAKAQAGGNLSNTVAAAQAAMSVKDDVQWLISFIGNIETLADKYEEQLKAQVPRIQEVRKRLIAEAQARQSAQQGGNQGQ